MRKNVANQKLTVFAVTANVNTPATGLAGTITAFVLKGEGNGPFTALTDTTGNELDATNAPGYYTFDLTQDETNADKLTFSATCSTPGIVVIAVPAVEYPDPETETVTVTTVAQQTSSLILLKQNRGVTKDILLLNADGDAIIPLSTDKVRAILGRAGEIGDDLSGADLVVTSDAATANGSTFTKNYPSDGKNRLRIDASDVTMGPGVYTLWVDYYDSNDTNEWKNASESVVIVERV